MYEAGEAFHFDTEIATTCLQTLQEMSCTEYFLFIKEYGTVPGCWPFVSDSNLYNLE